MTRTSNDVDLSNVQRAEMANKAGADLFVRLHADAGANPAMRGVSVLYPGGNAWVAKIEAPSKRAATAVSSALVRRDGRARRRHVAARRPRGVQLEQGARDTGGGGLPHATVRTTGCSRTPATRTRWRRASSSGITDVLREGRGVGLRTGDAVGSGRGTARHRARRRRRRVRRAVDALADVACPATRSCSWWRAATVPDTSQVAQLVGVADLSRPAGSPCSSSTRRPPSPSPGTSYDQLRDAYPFGGGAGVSEAYAAARRASSRCR